MTGRHVFTIGHSTHSADEFLGLLRLNSVTALADVRSSPYSRFAPHFNRDSLRQLLAEHGIGYAFLGRELGARSEDPSCYEEGRVVYSRLAATAAFRAGIERIVSGAHSESVALVCAEKDPLDCHRTLLVARVLVDEGTAVDHILADGSLESHDAAMTRLLGKFGLLQTNIFRSPEELLGEALARQESRVAYVNEALLSVGPESGG